MLSWHSLGAQQYSSILSQSEAWHGPLRADAVPSLKQPGAWKSERLKRIRLPSYSSQLRSPSRSRAPDESSLFDLDHHCEV